MWAGSGDEASHLMNCLQIDDVMWFKFNYRVVREDEARKESLVKMEPM